MATWRKKPYQVLHQAACRGSELLQGGAWWETKGGERRVAHYSDVTWLIKVLCYPSWGCRNTLRMGAWIPPLLPLPFSIAAYQIILPILAFSGVSLEWRHARRSSESSAATAENTVQTVFRVYTGAVSCSKTVAKYYRTRVYLLCQKYHSDFTVPLGAVALELDRSF